MKKSLCFALIFMALWSFSLPLAIGWVDRGKEEIAVVEEVLFGDPAVAEGITFHTASCWEGHLLWNTMYTVGSGKEAESSFTFTSRKASGDWTAEKSVKLRPEGGAGFGSAFTDAATVVQTENLPFSQIIQAVAKEAAAGAEYSLQVRIGDYYENYPLVLDIEGESIEYEGDYAKACNWLTDFFHIPTAEDRYEVTVKKDAAGDLVYVSAQVNQGEQQVNITDASAFAQDGFYYTFCLEDAQTKEEADRGQNRGIFFFPWEQRAQDEDFRHLDLTRARKVCEYSGDGVPLQMTLLEEEGRMYLTVRKKDEYFLCVYEMGENELILRQRISLGRHRFDFCRMSPAEGGILFTWENNEFSFVTRENEESEEFCLWCRGEFPQASEELETGGRPFPRENACLFNGERLALAAFERKTNMDVMLAVYDRSGMLYSGLYYNGGKPDPENPFVREAYGIRPWGERLWIENVNRH